MTIFVFGLFHKSAQIIAVIKNKTQPYKNWKDIENKILCNKEIMTYDKALKKVNKAKYSLDIGTTDKEVLKLQI